MRFVRLGDHAVGKVFVILSFLLFPNLSIGQSFTIDENGIVKCKGVNPGVKGTVSGVEYEAVDRALLIQRRDEGKDLTKVCVSNVTDMSFLFFDSEFNQPIGNWDVRNVIDMDWMFRSSNFNQPINEWCVVAIAAEPANFSNNSPLVAANKPVWGTCPGMPDPIVQLLPVNNATGIDRLPVLTWDTDENSTSYQLQVIEGSNTLVIDTTITTTQFYPSIPLAGNTTHNWKVRGINNNKNYTGKWGQSWSFTTSMGTSIATDELPLSFNLHQNFPNPFNPTTVIEFTLPSSTNIKLEVFSPLGQLVAVLVDGNLGMGHHSVPFDAHNLSSGVYLYRITTPDAILTRKMTLVK